jgi:hypothetical protein
MQPDFFAAKQKLYLELRMLNKIWDIILPNLIGLGLIIVGWYISILNVGLTTRIKSYQEIEYITTWTIVGLVLIIIGAYIPRLWNKIRGK